MVQAPCPHKVVIEGGEDVAALVRIVHSGESLLCRVPAGVSLGCGDHVIIPTRYGRDLARVLGPVSDENRSRFGELVSLHRVAVPEDLERDRENEARAQHALAVCRERVDERGLPMVLASAHYVLDEPRLVFFFTADSRVDFRELVKDLVQEFHVRIELRQIGVRDESRIVGGLGVCGRVLCCHGVSDRLKAVSIKMAKVQGLSLNSTKISGPCGRLLCCLEYEYDFYREEKRGLPNVGARVRHDGTSFRITEVNVLNGQIRMEGDGRAVSFPSNRIYQEPKTQRWTVDDAASRETPAYDAEPDSIPVGPDSARPGE
ncbi:MAG: PSP1 domain-containing protein [Spirochaetota bacterium]